MINQHEGGTHKMKQRFIALLLAVCIACTMLVMPASASMWAATTRWPLPSASR